MYTYLALFRGINVGGRHALPMKDLRALLEKNGCVDVQTYVQSGNAIFRSPVSNAPRLATRLKTAIGRSHGFEPAVLLLTRAELELAVSRNPFPDAVGNPRTLHVFFLADPPKQPDTKAMHALKAATERFVLDEQRFYLHAPDGLGTSKLGARAERLLGVDATARNWRTVTTLADMLRTLER